MDKNIYEAFTREVMNILNGSDDEVVKLIDIETLADEHGFLIVTDEDRSNGGKGTFNAP